MSFEKCPKMTGLKIEGNQAEFSICLMESLPSFQGHFPQEPILPGVTQIHWAVLWGQQLFSINEKFKGMNPVKFHIPTRPGDVLNVSLVWDPEKLALSFQYSLTDHVVSSGRIRFA